MFRWRRSFRVVLLALLGAGAARANDADVVFVDAQGTDRPGELREVVTLTGSTLGLLAPVDADRNGELSQADLSASAKALAAGAWDEMPLSAGGVACARSDERALLREGFVELSARFACGGGELRQDFRFLSVLPANYRVVLGSQVEGEAGRATAYGRTTALPLPRPPPPGRFGRARFDSGFRQGVSRGLTLDALAALGLLSLVSGAWAARRLGLVLAGLTLASWWGLPTLAGAAALTACAVLLARGPERWGPWLAVVIGAALGSRWGGGAWPEVLGLMAGSALVVGAVFAVGWPVERALTRRPRARAVVAWSLAVASSFALGFQLLAALQS